MSKTRYTAFHRDKKLSGKWFHHDDVFTTKRKAKRRAEWVRKRGYNARVLKGESRSGKVIYRVYKRRRRK